MTENTLPMVGLLSQLTPGQKGRALSYRGPENVGGTEFRLNEQAVEKARQQIDGMFQILPAPGDFFPQDDRAAWLTLMRWLLNRAYPTPQKPKPWHMQHPYLW